MRALAIFRSFRWRWDLILGTETPARRGKWRARSSCEALEVRTLLAAVATTTSISAASAVIGQGIPDTITATVATVSGTGTPTGGTVAFYGSTKVLGGSTLIGTAPLTNGTAQVSMTATTVATYVIRVIYSGDGANYLGSTNAVTPNSPIFTIAGGVDGDGGAATAAYLDHPNCVAADFHGDIYIGVRGAVRKVDALTGLISTVAGTKGSGNFGDGGLAIYACLGNVSAIAVNAADDLFVATEYNIIRKIDHATGIITTVVGNGTTGYSGDGGPATSAKLSGAGGMAFDGAGNLFFSDTYNNVIREVTASTGIITTVAGNGAAGFSGDGGPATSAMLNVPQGLTISANGDVFIADMANSRVRKLDAVTHLISTVAGNGSFAYSGDGGPAAAAALSDPIGLALDSFGNLCISDSGNDVIRLINGGGTISTIATGLSGPDGLALDAAGNLIVVDDFNSRVRMVSPVTHSISTVAGVGNNPSYGEGGPGWNAHLTDPVAVVSDAAGNLFIASYDYTVRRVDQATGVISSVAGIYATIGDGGLAFDAAGNLYVSDHGGNRIQKVNLGTGVITTVAGNGTAGFTGDGGLATSASINQPNGITFDAAGNLFIADTGNHRVRKVNLSTGIITTVAGNGTSGDSGDGGAATAATLYPLGVAVDPSGKLFIGNDISVRQVDLTTGVITTAVSYGIGNLYSIACDQSGIVYIGGNGFVDKVNPATHSAQTIAGFGQNYGGFTGDRGAAQFAEVSGVHGVAVDPWGNLFLADRDNYRVREIMAGTFVTVEPTVTITLSPQSSTYGAAPTIDQSQYIVSGLPNGVSLSNPPVLATSVTSGTQAGAYSTAITGSGAAAPGCFISYTVGTWTVTPAHLTVTANGLSKAYGSANLALTSSITGFVNGDTAAVVSGSAALSTTATASSGVGSYPISVGPGTLSAANYDFPTLVNGTLTINPAVLMVTATNLSKAYGAGNPSLTFTITGFKNGDTSSVVSGSPTLATTATATSSPGGYPITVSVSPLHATNYTFTGVAGTLTVNPAAFFSPTSGAVSYTALGAHKVLAAGGLLSDPTSKYASSSLSVQTTNAGPNDRLELALSNAGVQSVSGGSGTSPLLVTFTATATQAQVQSALQNVAYYNATSRPSLVDRAVQLTFTNGATVKSSRSATVHMIAAAFLNGVPATVNYIAPDPAVKLASAATLTDDNPNAFAGSQLKVTNTNGGSSDALGITAGGNLTVGAGTLSYTGIGPIGTFSGGTGQNPLVVSFNGSATAAAVQAVLQAVNISSSNPVATPFNRSISFEFIDSLGINSKVATPTTEKVHLVTRPSITGLGNTSYTLSTSPAQIQLAAAAVVNMPSGQTAGAVLSIQLLNGSGNDRLTIQTGAGVTMALVGGVNQVSVNGTQIGTYAFTGGASSNAPPNNLLLTMTFNGNASAGSIQAVLRNVAYYNVSASSSVYNRGVEFKLVDGTSPTPVSSKAIDTIILVSH